jgi:hypothetical protein
LHDEEKLIHHPTNTANGNGGIEEFGIERYASVFSGIYHSSKWSEFTANWYWLV